MLLPFVLFGVWDAGDVGTEDLMRCRAVSGLGLAGVLNVRVLIMNFAGFLARPGLEGIFLTSMGSSLPMWVVSVNGASEVYRVIMLIASMGNRKWGVSTCVGRYYFFSKIPHDNKETCSSLLTGK